MSIKLSNGQEANTVAEFIERLAQQPQDLPICISDADTNWLGVIIHITNDEGFITLRIEYHEMDSSL